MQKRLQDDHDIHQEEHDELMEIVEYEKKLLVDGEMEKTKQIAEKISSKRMVEMHESLKDMALHNNQMQNEIEFYKTLIQSIKGELIVAENEIKVVKQDPKRNLRNILFNDIINPKKEICLPEMSIDLGFKTKMSLD